MLQVESEEMAESNNTALLFPLFILFLILKLCGAISWSWWWVTCPLWGPFAIIIGIFVFIFLLVFLYGG